MTNSGMVNLELTVEWVKPANVMDLGLEALKLPLIPAIMFNEEHWKVITNPIRWGFEDSFAREGTPNQGWGRLSFLTTVPEREELVGQPGMVPDFTPTHPILQRTGEYKRSWTNVSHPLNKLEIDVHGLSGSRAGYVEVVVGSKDPRAERLSLGEDADHLVGRLVNVISDHRLDRIGQIIIQQLEGNIGNI